MLFTNQLDSDAERDKGNSNPAQDEKEARQFKGGGKASEVKTGGHFQAHVGPGESQGNQHYGNEFGEHGKSPKGCRVKL